MHRILLAAVLGTLLVAVPVLASAVHLFQGEGYAVRLMTQGDRNEFVSGLEFAGPNDTTPFFVDNLECKTITYDPGKRDLFILFVNPGAPRFPPLSPWSPTAARLR